MSAADYVSIAIILAFCACGAFLGAVRSIMLLLGMIFATSFVERMVDQGATQGAYVWTFIGITAAFTVGGFLLYGYSRITFIESMEGVFGAIIAGAAGWGIARFVLSVFLYYLPESSFAMMIVPGTSIAWDIYNVTPWQILMGRTESLRNPSPDLGI